MMIKIADEIRDSSMNSMLVLKDDDTLVQKLTTYTQNYFPTL